MGSSSPRLGLTHPLRVLEREIDISGVNYVLTRFAFGDLTHEESVHSLSLFTAKVMPEFTSEPGLCLMPMRSAARLLLQ